MKEITLAVPTRNRFTYACECVDAVVKDPRIGEVVLSDDCSDDGSYEKLQAHYRDISKVRIVRNVDRLDCYGNKAAAVRAASNEWVILFDDDNIIHPRYLDAIENQFPWEEDTAYLPVFAEPHFDYRAFSGLTITHANVASYVQKGNFTTALNTCNCFVNREAWLDIWDGSVNPHTADSIFMNYRWLASRRRLFFVSGMEYFHRVHKDSHYKNNVHKTGSFARVVESNLASMR
ncbi:MAG: putative glycosyl transferase family 2 [Prokaryotic dsDNA virus sp.]|nr:MAG: putative glycosyl transferase family 2 [Prokaryotic dsDNA virus sp.]|tara:strand:- start:56642 stop:57340 length:699 start_codon:yes stop_codon:yes gene_type:complete